MKITPPNRIQLHNLISIGLTIISLLLMLSPMGKISRFEYLVMDIALKKGTGVGKTILAVVAVLLCAAAVYAVVSTVLNRGKGMAVYFGLNGLLVCIDVFLVFRIYCKLNAYMEYVDMARKVLKWVDIDVKLALITLAKNILLAGVCSGIAFAVQCMRPKKKAGEANDPSGPKVR